MKLKNLILDTIIYCSREMGVNLDGENLHRQFPELSAADLELHIKELVREGFISYSQGAAGRIELIPAAVRTIPQIPVIGRRTKPPVRPGQNLLTLDLCPLGYVLPRETIAFEVGDLFMIEAGIGEGDIAIFAVALPKAGDIVVLDEHTGLTLRRYVEIDGVPYLMREHPRGPELLRAFEAKILGVLWLHIKVEPCHPRITAPAKRFKYSTPDEIEAKRQRELSQTLPVRRKRASALPAPSGAFMINPGAPFSFGRLSDTPGEYRARSKGKSSPTAKQRLPEKSRSKNVTKNPKKQSSQTR